MAMLSNLMIHDVTSIELSSFRPDNENSRTITIWTEDGRIDICVFGRTEGLASVPHAAGYRAPYSPLEVHELSEAAE